MSEKLNDRYSSKPMKPDQAALHATLALQTVEFLARGGRVNEIETGLSGEDMTASRALQTKKVRGKK